MSSYLGWKHQTSPRSLTLRWECYSRVSASCILEAERPQFVAIRRDATRGETKLKILELLRFSQLTGDIAALTSDSLTLLIT